MTIYIIIPVGSFHGWGVCGKYLVKELSNFSEVKLITEGLSFENVNDELDYRLISSKLLPDREIHAIKNRTAGHISHPVLQGITGKTMVPFSCHIKGSKNVGYTFFEDTVFNPSYIKNGKTYYDIIVTGSTWCENVLRSYGLENVKTIIQGIDPTIFNPYFSEKEYFRDSFVIFSGGKFEFRKGQDIVLRAFRYLQNKYKDVLLINSWFNLWPFSFHTMKASPHIRFSPGSDDYLTMMNKLYHNNGIDVKKVITLPLYPNTIMARMYKNSDIGLFPNRCEGGTNLVLMEYMACGKPVIASYNSGHKDILTDKNSLRIETMKSITISDKNGPIAVWDEPSLDETIEKLEWAYLNRDTLKEFGNQAGKDLSSLTWGRTAQSFYETLINY
jgi:glycosyltransferase involved in cell wall biosynthesis